MPRTMPPRNRTPKPTALYRWRMAVGLTQREAAEKMGVGFTTFRKLESLAKLPKLHALAFEALQRKHPAT